MQKAKGISNIAFTRGIYFHYKSQGAENYFGILEVLKPFQANLFEHGYGNSLSSVLRASPIVQFPHLIAIYQLTEALKNSHDIVQFIARIKSYKCFR